MPILPRRARRTISPRLAAGLAAMLTLVAAPLASGQDQPAKPATAGKAVPVLLVEHSGCAAMLVDAKDQALKNALAMLPERISELPEEIPGMQALPMPVIDLFLSALSRPGRLAVTYNSEDQSGGAFGAGVVLSIGPTEEQFTSDMQKTVSEMLAQSPLGGQLEESSLYKGMMETPTPMGGLLRFGPRKAKDGWRYEIHFGTAPDPDAAFAALPGPAAGAPADFKPVLRARLDLAPMEPFVQMFAAMAGGAARRGGAEGGDEDQPGIGGADAIKMTIDRLRKAGVIGPDAVKYTYQSGTTKDGHVSFMVVEGMKKFAEAQGLGSPVTDKDLAIIPADATVAVLSKGGMSAMIKSLQEAVAAAPPVGEGLAHVKDETGVDLIGDLLGSVGETLAVYLSETTGGGDLGSAVAVASLKDRAKFQGGFEKLAAYVMEKAEETPAGGHVRVRQWSHGGATMHTLTFPGLPVPLEITAAFQGDWLVMGMTPQATIAAAQQIGGGGKGAGGGLKDNKSFAAVYPRDNRPVGSFSFVDTARVMRSGYQYVSMFGSAIANLSRSAVAPDAPNREPGLVVPTYAELREGARPIISFTYWRGNDLVTESHADRSMLVNAAGAIGAASPVFPIIGAAFGAAAGSANGRLPKMPGGMMDEVILHR